MRMSFKMLKNVLLTGVALQLFAIGTARTAQAQTTVTLAATQNASLSTLSGNTTDGTEVYVGSGTGAYDIALQWDLSSVASAYPGYQITDATLGLSLVYRPSAVHPGVWTDANLLNPAAGNSGIVSATATWNILNGNDTSGNPATYNYFATATTSALGQYSMNASVGDLLTSTASASDLTILNQRLTESLTSDQYVLLQMAATAMTGTWNVGFQNNTVSLAAGTYAQGAPGSGPGIAPTLTLTLSPPVTLLGDVNGDHVVNGLDIAVVASHWLSTGATLGQGDANGDGTVNGLDIALIASHWLNTSPGPGAGSGEGNPGAAAVPEPSTCVLALIGIIGLAYARRRYGA